VIAVPLSRLKPRQGRYARLWVAVVIYLVYSNLITLGRSWIEHGTVPASIGLWWTHGAVIAAAALLVLGPRWLARLRHRDTRDADELGAGASTPGPGSTEAPDRGPA
jgi:lipopolysaccharide export system permease protein